MQSIYYLVFLAQNYNSAAAETWSNNIHYRVLAKAICCNEKMKCEQKILCLKKGDMGFGPYNADAAANIRQRWGVEMFPLTM
jgi:hypothetical protein